MIEMKILIVSMLRITSDSLDRSLSLLGELLAARNHPHRDFVVFGGSSLLALGLVSRTTTKDVDILARISEHEVRLLREQWENDQTHGLLRVLAA